MQKLRDEIIESQRSRSDLLKWKLIIISTLGAVGLGIVKYFQVGDDLSKHLSLVLLVIPLASLYVDILCYHLALRMIVIGTFLKCHELHEAPSSLSPELLIFHKYEVFASQARINCKAFTLEDWALCWSTIVLSGLVVIYGYYGKTPDLPYQNRPFYIIGAIGIVFTIILRFLFSYKAQKLEKSKLSKCPEPILE